ncbi:MAG: MarR family transcriptional regulator, partial [Actinomycetota bacterium]|nr:MarR family transcriptional regulator [Actinomycetota bacterium]
MRAGSDDERLQVWFTLMRAHAAVSEALGDDLEKKRNMPLSWYEVLIGLSQEPEGRRRMQDLASFALLSKSGLSRLVDRMEEAGLVRRESCPADRRGTFAVL